MNTPEEHPDRNWESVEARAINGTNLVLSRGPVRADRRTDGVVPLADARPPIVTVTDIQAADRLLGPVGGALVRDISRLVDGPASVADGPVRADRAPVAHVKPPIIVEAEAEEPQPYCEFTGPCRPMASRADRIPFTVSQFAGPICNLTWYVGQPGGRGVFAYCATQAHAQAVADALNGKAVGGWS